MSVRGTIGGKPITDEQIQAWANEAEAGYDYAALKRRSKGRPGRGAAPSQVIALRLTEEELAELDGRVKDAGTTRSDVIRTALQFASV